MATGMPNMDPSTIPLAPDPHGGPPNFVDPPSLQPVVIGVGLTMIITSGFFMILRLYTNIRNTGKLGADDFGLDGAARHTWDVPLSIMTPSFLKVDLARHTKVRCPIPDML
ncbi:MAG: hypothetical protein Q9203_004327 [Teloschistes exilis]